MTIFQQNIIFTQPKNEETICKSLGFLIIFDTNINSKLQICSYDFNHYKFKNNKDFFNKVILEDIDFNNFFNVFATKEHDAFYLLTPQIIEQLKLLINKINFPFQFSFVNNKLYILIDSNKNMFNIDSIKEEKINNSLFEDSEYLATLIKHITDFIKFI